MLLSSKIDEQKAQVLNCNEEGLRDAALILNAGGLVAFPTETVYGLGANALNAESVKNIFLAKKRPANDPLIVHILSKDNIYDLFDFSGLKPEINGKSRAQVVCELLMDAFWPGPLTVIFKAKSAVPLEVTSGTGFVGLRSPRHLVARKLLEASNLPVAAPSANRFGHVSPTSPVSSFLYPVARSSVHATYSSALSLLHRFSRNINLLNSFDRSTFSKTLARKILLFLEMMWRCRAAVKSESSRLCVKCLLAVKRFLYSVAEQ
jgi:tRNA threonylcarbamoyl adenosine modification protein (Sua5/YciO/YrdC/YwlC family)